jgi:hypothetical protein
MERRNAGLGSKKVSAFSERSNPLNGRVASTDFVGPSISSNIQERLKKKSPWFDSIMSPINGGGVKIPDPVGTNTATYQHVESVNVNANEQGISGLRIISPYINNYQYGQTEGPGSNYQIVSTTGTLANLNFVGANPSGIGAFPFGDDLPASMKANAQSHRIVSGYVVAETEVSTLADAGEMCAFVKPFSCNPHSVPYSVLQSQWDTTLTPVNKHRAVAARHYPISSDYVPFNCASEIADQEPPAISYQDFVDPNIEYDDTPTADQGVIPWEMGVVCVGMTPGSIVRYKIVINYELIPKTMTSFISGKPSPVDATQIDLVSGWVSECEITGLVSDKEAASPAKESTVEDNDPTGFGMIFNVVQEMAPFLKAGLALL